MRSTACARTVAERLADHVDGRVAVDRVVGVVVAPVGGARRRRRRARRPGASGSGSRSKSTRLSESFSPPTPSVIVWWIRWSSAARPPSRPSMSVNSHSGRDRSSGGAVSDRGDVEEVAHRPRLGERDPADVVVDVERRVGAATRAARCAAAATRPARRAAGSRRCACSTFARSRSSSAAAVEDREVAEVGAERRVLLDRPHDRFARRHPHGVRLLGVGRDQRASLVRLNSLSRVQSSRSSARSEVVGPARAP